MRARGIKPGFFKNELLGQLDPWVQLLFIGLWCMADRKGRLEFRPQRIKAELFPYRDCTFTQVEDELVVLAANGFLILYEADGRRLLQIVNFEKHQHVHHKENESIYPAAPDSPRTSPGLAPDRPPTDPSVICNLKSVILNLKSEIPILKSENPEEVCVSAFKERIKEIAAKTLSVAISLRDRDWPEMTALGKTHGYTRVGDAFQEWATSVAGEPISYPLSRFCRLAEGMLIGSIVVTPSPETTDLLHKLIETSGGQVLFTRKQQTAVHRLREKYTAAEILTAFQQCLENAAGSTYKLSRLPDEFPEQAPLLIESIRKQQEREAAMMAASHVVLARDRARIEAEDKQRRATREAENAAFDALFGPEEVESGK